MTETAAPGSEGALTQAIGTVVALWRYPVKSMLGEEIGGSVLGEGGLAGDRAYALVDVETGKVASAKNPKKWPNLFDCAAEYVESPLADRPPPPVQITLPGGATVRSDDAEVHEVLSQVVGRRVTLTTEVPRDPVLEQHWPDMDDLSPDGQRNVLTDEKMGIIAPGTFFDAAPLTLLTTATLARLTEVYPQGRFEVPRFRPNVVVDVEGAEPGFVENEWVGKTLAIGADVCVSVLVPDPRCVMTTLPQGDLPKDPGILRAAAQHNRIDVADLGKYPCVGVYAALTAGGSVRRGDPVSVI